MDDDVMTTGLPSVAVAVHGDPAGDHVVSILQDGTVDHMPVGGHIGNAIAAHGLLARVISLFRLAAGVTAANAAAAAPITDSEFEEVEPVSRTATDEADLAAATAASPPMGGLGRYQSIKKVCAGVITEVVLAGCYVQDADGTAVLRPFLPNMTARFQPQVGDYWVVYDDGYQALSPAKAFEEGYVLVAVPEPVSPMPPAAPTKGAGSATDPAEPAATPGQGAAGDEKAADAG
jgi:hypothetical protein